MIIETQYVRPVQDAPEARPVPAQAQRHGEPVDHRVEAPFTITITITATITITITNTITIITMNVTIM